MPRWLQGEYQLDLAANCKTIRDFDDAITRVSFGWPGVDAYYQGLIPQNPPTLAVSWPHQQPLHCVPLWMSEDARSGLACQAMPLERNCTEPGCSMNYSVLCRVVLFAVHSKGGSASSVRTGVTPYAVMYSCIRESSFQNVMSAVRMCC